MIGRMKDRDWAELLHTLGHDPSLTIVQTLVAPVTPAESDLEWSTLETTAQGCTQCALAKERTQVVFGSGLRTADFMFVGEGPGYHEDECGVPFAGPAGELLTKMITAMGLSRDTVYITNVVKCHPPENRDPRSEEIATCSTYLETQVKLVQPKWIIALGNIATQYFLETDAKISTLRGQIHTNHRWFRGEATSEPIRIVPTFHPAYLLRNPDMKKACWDDLQMVMRDAGLK